RQRPDRSLAFGGGLSLSSYGESLVFPTIPFNGAQVARETGADGCCRCDTTGKTLRPSRNRARCPAPSAKIFIFPKIGNGCISTPSRLDTRTFRPIVTRRGAGCDGRGAQDECADACGQAVWS